MNTLLKPETTLPEILAEHPHLRGIFDQYGLKGCGGEQGPSESLGFFAETHGVSLDKLTCELEAAIQNPKLAPSVDYRPSLADAIYVPFFVAGLLILLGAGVLFGMHMLFSMHSKGTVLAAPPSWMNAHAHAMVYGWMGLYILGFGYQALPRFKHAALWRPKLAFASFALMTLGILLRFPAELFAPVQETAAFGTRLPWLVAGLAGTAFELTAVVLFLLVILRTYRESGKPTETYDRYILAAALWLLVSVPASGALFVLTSTAGNQGELLNRITIFQEPLRVIQLLGVGAMMILGVSLRFLPPVFGFRNPGERQFRRLFWPLNLAILGSAALFALMMASKRSVVEWLPPYRVVGGLYSFSTLVMVGCFLCLSFAFRPFSKTTGQDRSIKFLRAAHGWLWVSLLMLLLEPLYIILAAGHFGHGYHGAMRHAFTAGFLSMTIIAVASKVGPTLNGLDTQKLTRLWGVFLLLNLGVILRAAGEIAADFTTSASLLLPVSGALMTGAFLLWAAHVVRILRTRQRSTEGMTVETASVVPHARVALVLERWPQTLEVFVAHGFGLLKNPVFRKTMARKVTLQQACEFQNVDLVKLMEDLRAVTREDDSAPVAETSCGGHPVDPKLPVVEVARRWPAAVPVFQRLGLDACCGGAESVENAAEHNHVPLDRVMKELKEAIGEQPQ